MKVGNTSIENEHGLFEQECDCNMFPCNCYYQDNKGHWKKKEDKK